MLKSEESSQPWSLMHAQDEEGQTHTIVAARTGTTGTPSRHCPCVVGSNSLLGLDEFRTGPAPQVSSLGGCEEGDGGDKRELHFGYGLEDREEASGQCGKMNDERVWLDILYERKVDRQS